MMGTASVALVRAAFDMIRQRYGPPREPQLQLRHPSERDAMTLADGVVELIDGPGSAATAPRTLKPLDPVAADGAARVWAVRADDVVHAPKHCAFGRARPAGEVKHTNLTAGGIAFTAGELIFVDDATIVVNGDSGRYGTRNATEMQDVAIAFKQSGYTVYSMGYDLDANEPIKFSFVGAPAPTLI